MRIEDREEFVDQVAQAVIDRIEERDRIAGLVNLVVARVLELQKEQTQQTSPEIADSQEESQEDIHVGDGKEPVGSAVENGQFAR